MNPKLLEIWKETRYGIDSKDYVSILMTGLVAGILKYLNSNLIYYIVLSMFIIQIIMYYALTLSDSNILAKKSIRNAKNIYEKLKDAEYK